MKLRAKDFSEAVFGDVIVNNYSREYPVQRAFLSGPNPAVVVLDTHGHELTLVFDKKQQRVTNDQGKEVPEFNHTVCRMQKLNKAHK